MHIQPVLPYRDKRHAELVSASRTCNSGQTLNRVQGDMAAQPAFEGRMMNGILATIFSAFMAIGAHAQSTATKIAEKAPEYINPKIVQFDPLELKVAYVAPYNKKITQQSLTKDSLDIIEAATDYNRLMKENGWAESGLTAEEYAEYISKAFDDFFTDKIRFWVSDGRIKLWDPPANLDINELKKSRVALLDFSKK